MKENLPTPPADAVPPTRTDRWFWTSRSPGNNGTGLSYLAVGESVIGTAAFTVLVTNFGWYFLLVTAVLLVPLALMRTDKSDQRARDYARRMLTRNGVVEVTLTLTNETSLAVDVDTRINSTGAWWYSVKVLFVVTIARMCALVVSIVRDFWGSIAAMPNNWYRVCLSTDLLRSVELIPGSPDYPAYGPFADRIRYSVKMLRSLPVHWFWLTFGMLVSTGFIWISLVFDGLDLTTAWILTKSMAVIVAVVIAPLYLAYAVAIWYRWSLKSTSVVWLPLLYIAADVTSRGRTVEQRLSSAIHSRFAATMRQFGLACSVLILAWLVLRAIGVTVHPTLLVFSPAIDRYFGGEAVVVAAWSFASVVNTLLAWLVYWLADNEIARRKHGEGRSDATVLGWLKAVTLIRWFLFMYSWMCSLWIAAEIAAHSRPVAVSPQWVPW